MKRGSGVLLHISSLPATGGIGDLGPQAYAFADFCLEAKQSYWQVLPLNPTDGGSWHSPYLTSGTFAGNPLFISLDQLVDHNLLEKNELVQLENLPRDRVDFGKVESAKLTLLEKAFSNLMPNHPLYAPFMEFCRTEAGWLDDYALFKTLKARFHNRWWIEWPTEFRDRDVAALTRAVAEHDHSIRQVKFFQYLFFSQWAALKAYCNRQGIALIGDVPIYVAHDSCDVWAHPAIFKLNSDRLPTMVSGVPPDYFSATGQLWNTPVYCWDVLKASGYAWWLQRLELQLQRCDIVRIDHFRGLVQYWEVPAGEKTAMNGTWQPVPAYDFFDAFLKRIPHFENKIIAEDLGTITDDVREVMQHYNLPGMKVLAFAFGEDNPKHPYLPENFEANFVAYTGTHDNNTFRGWLEEEATVEDKRRFFKYIGRQVEPSEAVWKIIRKIMQSVADLVILPVQDILTLPAADRMNRPAYPENNWSWRLLPGQLTAAVARRLARETSAASRH
jgi:4-alpha-glucanotransferase